MDVAGLDSVFEEVLHPFDGLKTAFKQEKYFKDCLGLVVSDIAWFCIVHPILILSPSRPFYTLVRKVTVLFP